MPVAIGPGPELFQDPRGLPARRIRQAISECLRPGRLLPGIAGIPIGVIFDALQRARFLGRRLAFHIGSGRHRHRDVNAGAMRGILCTDRGGDHRSPIAALRAVSRITQAIHQHRPARCNTVDAPAGCLRLPGEAKARQRRTDDVKRVGGVAAVRGRIGQRLDHLVKLDHRARPAVRDDQRHRFRMRRADMQEVNVEPVDFSGELRKAIEPRLALAPVVLFRPVAADVPDPFQRRALAPVIDQFSFRPACVAQPRFEVVEDAVADRNAIGFDFSAHVQLQRDENEQVSGST